MPDFTQPNQTETKPEKPAVDLQAEQLKVLQSINGKLGFFVFLSILYIIISIFGALLS